MSKRVSASDTLLFVGSILLIVAAVLIVGGLVWWLCTLLINVIGFLAVVALVVLGLGVLALIVSFIIYKVTGR